MQKLIECVPNFSEGRDMGLIRKITDEIEGVESVQLLNVDPGKATNRTVVTFVGPPEAVVEAAFRAIQKAGELIDMSRHKGTHPRMGATDVCPLIPVSGITMEETVQFALALAKRVGAELALPVYLYEHAQPDKNRSNLSAIRAGEYEGFFQKINDPKWKPDYGPVQFDRKRGAVVIGAREFLVAYNINLNTTSVRRANAIAFDVREAGRTILKNGAKINQPGTLKSVKAIGWYIEEYGIAQISMNLTDIGTTPVHIAFDEVCRKAEARGIRVTGSELVGLIPLKAMLDAARYFLKKQKRSVGLPENELIRIAARSLGLDELTPFKPEEKIIEYLLENRAEKKLIHLSLTGYANATSAESPAPGGGSASAYVGALGISLGTMVANLSAHKKGWDDRWEEFSNWAEKGEKLKNELLQLVDADTNAFKKILTAMSLPKTSEQEKQLRAKAIQEATRESIEVPFKVMQAAYASMEIIKAMTEKGNPNSITDAGVGALCARSAVKGAYMNVRINAVGYEDKDFLREILAQGKEIEEKATALETEIVRFIDEHISSNA